MQTKIHQTEVLQARRPLYLRILLVSIVVLVYAVLWNINKKPLGEREYFYQTYFSFRASWPQPFMDWRWALIWLDCVRAGAPIDKPCALGSDTPWAYPPAWLLLSHTGLSARQTIPTAALLYVGLVAVISYMFHPSSIPEVCYETLFLVSPPFVLALERCNMDVLIFILLGLALVLRRWRAGAGAFGVVWVAALLKMYPGVSLLAFTRKKSDVFAAGACASTLLVYLVLIHKQLAILRTYLAQTEYLSFGYPELFLILSKKLQVMGYSAPLISSVIPVFALVGWTFLVAFIALAIWRKSINTGLKLSDGLVEQAFLIGALVYCACWSLGMSFNYRYIFIAFTLPQAWAWANLRSRWRWLSRTYLAAALSMAWLSLFQFKHPWIEGAHALLGWVLYGVLLLTLILAYKRVLITMMGEGPSSPTSGLLGRNG